MSETVYGMITSYERDYLRELASRGLRFQGAVVDLGCWLGSSTAALAEGLDSNPDPRARTLKIHAYDRFIWEDWMNFPHIFQNSELADHFRPGDSFLEECKRLCQPWQRQIEFHAGDLVQLGWKGGSIELLFVDAMKSWELANAILSQFYPHLIPGVSVVIQQDFWHHCVYWLHLISYRLREYFEPVYDVPYSASLAFKLIRPIPQELLLREYSPKDFGADEIQAAYEYCSGLIAEHKRPMLSLSKVALLLEQDQPEQLQRAVDELSYQLYCWPVSQNLTHQIQALEKELDSLKARRSVRAALSLAELYRRLLQFFAK